MDDLLEKQLVLLLVFHSRLRSPRFFALLHRIPLPDLCYCLAIYLTNQQIEFIRHSFTIHPLWELPILKDPQFQCFQ